MSSSNLLLPVSRGDGVEDFFAMILYLITDNLSYLQRIHGSDNEVKIIAGIIARLLKGCNKFNFASRLSSIAKYLSHSNADVVKMAASAIVSIIENVVVGALTDSNLSFSTRLRIAKEFCKVFEEQILPFIGLFDLGARQSIESTIRLALSIIKEDLILQEERNSKNDKVDKFISSKLQSTVKSLIGNITPDQFVSHLKQISENLVGNTTPEHYVSSLSQSMGNLVGNIKIE